MSNVKVFAVQTSMTDYIEPHDNHLDQEPYERKLAYMLLTSLQVWHGMSSGAQRQEYPSCAYRLWKGCTQIWGNSWKGDIGDLFKCVCFTQGDILNWNSNKMYALFLEELAGIVWKHQWKHVQW